MNLRLLIACLLSLLTLRGTLAEQLFSLANGLAVRGTVAEIATLKDGFGAAAAGQMNVRPIWLIDDGLRRIYVHGKGMNDVAPVDVPDLEEPIEIYQRTPLGGTPVAALGTIVQLTPFNKFGRRRLTMLSQDGPTTIFQGITEISSRYAKVEALKSKPSIVWDQRVATSSIDSATLKMIFANLVPENDLDGRLEVLRFFIAAERYEDAWGLLSQIVKDFPEEADLKPELARLTELQGEQLLREAEVRAQAGQSNLARQMLDEFPLDAVGRITRLKVQDQRAKLDQIRDQSAALIAQLRQQIESLNEQQQQSLSQIVDEMESGLSAATLPRLSDYSRLGKAETIPVDSRIALAVSGWLLGSGSGEQNLRIATSLIQVRDLVFEYLGCFDPLRRQEILTALEQLEGAEPEYVDRMLPLLTPPLPFPEGSEDAAFEGLHEVQVDEHRYLIQLPPQYDPLREYPCIVALHESRAPPETQIGWWAGNRYNEKLGSRVGHASRYGFIVVAPVWGRPTQRAYEYTPREHERVLRCLRDAMRRSSIDADRVFIAGHGEGGTAAWDIALAHPDVWAGMISLSGAPAATRVVPHYEPNSEYVPLYIVSGDRDGSRVAGTLINDYMSFRHNAMVVIYRGRGREYFYDEMPRLFQWMMSPSQVRREMPREFEVKTMRRGDQFFWWIEVGDLKPDITVDPILWDRERTANGKPKRIVAGQVEARIGAKNQIWVSVPSDRFKILLRPMRNFDINDLIMVRYRGRRKPLNFDGKLNVMLEDARRRADRKRPFWMEASL